MLKEFESYCKEEFLKLKGASSKDFFNSLKYSFFSGGKRIRPSFILTLGKELGLKSRVLYPAAFAIELVHTYSLIHDDLPSMDDDQYRRGKLTHHEKYGEASAVLAGDGLLTFAFQILAENYKGEVLRSLILMLSQSSGGAGMIGGQVLDCMTTKRDKETFDKIHLLKTGMLFGFSMAAPAVIAGLVNSKVFEKLGHEIGLLFQLQDDLLDEDKKDERAEENILFVMSKSELLEKIQNKKEVVKKLLIDFRIDSKSQFYNLVETVFNRKV